MPLLGEVVEQGLGVLGDGLVADHVAEVVHAVKHFIASKKFMKAEGGLGRIVWMPKALKDQVAEKVNQSAKELPQMHSKQPQEVMGSSMMEYSVTLSSAP